MNAGETRMQSIEALSPRERLLALVRKILGQSALNRPLPIDARLSELGVSSIKMVSLMLAIEKEFDLAIPQCEITPENFASLATVEALILKIGGTAVEPPMTNAVLNPAADSEPHGREPAQPTGETKSGKSAT